MLCKEAIVTNVIPIYSLYWIEMVLCLIIILNTLQLFLKVDFVPLTPEEIERVEVEELKHRMEIKDK
jgi:hypothetical protein